MGAETNRGEHERRAEAINAACLGYKITGDTKVSDDLLDYAPTIEGGAVAIRSDAPPPAIAAPQSLLSAVMQLARDPQVDVGKLDALLRMQERMEDRQAAVEFNRALGRLPAIHVKKNGRIDLTKKDGTSSGGIAFAKWEDIAKVIEPLLEAEGFRLMFDSQPRPGDGGGLVVTGTLLHRDGHAKTASMPLPLDTGPGRNNLQAMGSSLSYGKRYCAEMLLNIVREGEDRDGADALDKISEADVDALMKLIAEAKADQPKFLDFMGVDRLADILARDYPRAVNALLAKLKKAPGQ